MAWEQVCHPQLMLHARLWRILGCILPVHPTGCVALRSEFRLSGNEHMLPGLLDCPTVNRCAPFFDGHQTIDHQINILLIDSDTAQLTSC